MADIDLTTNIGEFLKLSNPFWVSSAHYSDRESAIDGWASIEPAAITLKTAHKAPPKEDKPKVRFKTYPCVPRLGRSFYCDGPKNDELLPYDRVAELLRYAVRKLPKTQVGISVLAGTDQEYEKLRDACPEARFCELNLKYNFRFSKGKGTQFLEWSKLVFTSLLEEISRFVGAFNGLPVFIKVPRELSWLPGTQELSAFLDILTGHGKAGLLVANSAKLNVPPFIFDGKEESLREGVICGEHLFDSTIEFVADLWPLCRERHVPIVATGGMITPEHMLTALRAGACAVQLCTTFEYNKINYYNTLCWQLQSRIESRGLRSFSNFVTRLREEGVASIHNMPFMYLERFWSEETQRRIRIDIRRSERMDVLVMSGKTVAEEWSEDLTARLSKNLGLLLLLPNTGGPVYAAIQRSWGIFEGPELEARKHRVLEARQSVESVRRATASERKKNIREGEKENSVEILFYDQCPFYSFYLFDDKVYVAPYPFTRPGRLESPVYVFFAGSPEYERIKDEVDRLKDYALQTREAQAALPLSS